MPEPRDTTKTKKTKKRVATRRHKASRKNISASKKLANAALARAEKKNDAPAPKIKKKAVKPKSVLGSPHERNVDTSIIPLPSPPRKKRKLVKRTPIEHPSDDFPTVIAGRSPVRVIEPIEVRSPILDPVRDPIIDRGLLAALNPPQTTAPPIATPPQVDLSGVDQGLQNALLGQQGINTNIDSSNRLAEERFNKFGDTIGSGQTGINTNIDDLSDKFSKGQQRSEDMFKEFGQGNVEKLEGIEDLISGLQKNASESDTALADSISGAVGKFKTDVEGLVSGIGDSFSSMGDKLFGDNASIKDMLAKQAEFQSKGGIFGEIFRKFNDQRKFGMNDAARSEYNRLEMENRNDPGSQWNELSEEERVRLARKPQMDAQLPHAFIDGHPTTDVQKQIAALTGGKAPGSTIYGIDGKVDIAATAQLANQSPGGGGGGQPEAPAPKWWEPGYVPPGGGQPPVGGFPPSQPPIYGGGQPVQGLPAYLQRELAPTPDFTGSFQPSLLGNTTLPSQQITGLLAPQQPQQQQLNPQLLAGLLGGLV
jgi:hypothetical protein